MTKLGSKIAQLMAQKKITAMDIERATGLNRNTVYSIISGASKSPSAQNVFLISKVLDVSMGSLFDLDENIIKSEPLTLKQMQIFKEATVGIINGIIDRKISCSTEELLALVRPVYQYSMKNKPPVVHQVFIDWTIDQHFNF